MATGRETAREWEQIYAFTPLLSARQPCIVCRGVGLLCFRGAFGIQRWQKRERGIKRHHSVFLDRQISPPMRGAARFPLPASGRMSRMKSAFRGMPLALSVGDVTGGSSRLE
jgi:hypothetical protein